MIDRGDHDARPEDQDAAETQDAVSAETCDRVRVLIATTEGPVEVESVTREDDALDRSVICIGGLSEIARISERYHAFVAKPIGVVERLFGHRAFRLDIARDIDAGGSWQLGVLAAHALEAAGRLAERHTPDAPEPAGILVLATGEVRSRGLEVDPVDHIARKLDRAMPTLLDAVRAGRRVLVATPAGSGDQLSSEHRGALAAERIELLELTDAHPLFAALDLDVDAPDRAGEPSVVDRPPFPGAAAFQRADRPLFFGRDAARRAAVERLREAAATGCAFLTLYGASGVGKTSLLRAGLVDDLIEAVGPADGWRVALAEATPKDAIASIAGPIAEACPDLIDAATLELGILTDAEAIADELLARIAAAPQPLRLFIGVDRLECALLAKRPAPDAIGTFLERLTAAPGARVWAAATLRSSRIGALPRAPALERIFASGRRLRVVGLDRFEMKDAIEQPMRAAGLSIRGSHERPGGLVDRLVDEAARRPDGGALLARLLAELHEQDGALKELSAATLERMGGLDGAVRRWADQATSAARRGPDGEAALERVVLALAKLDLETGGPVPRRADADALRVRGSDAAMLNALVDARLVALDGDEATGRAAAMAATPALLTEWPMARAVLERRADMLALRDELELGARFWRRHGDDESILIGEGDGLENAAALLASDHAQLDADAAAYVRESLAAQRRRIARAERRGLLGAAGAVALTLVAALGLQLLMDAWAGGYETRAETLAGAAIELADAGRPQIAALLAVAAAPEPEREALAAALHRRSPTVERALYSAWSGVVEIDRPPAPPPDPRGRAAAEPAATGAPIGGVARFSPDERLLLVADGAQAAIYDWPRAGEARILSSAYATSAPIVDALFSPDGDFVVTRHADGRILRWRIEEGVFVRDLTAAAPPLGADPGRFADGDLFHRPNGDLVLVAGDGDVTIWEPGGGLVGPLDGGGPRVGPSALSADGAELVTLHEDGAQRWRLDPRTPAAPPRPAPLAAGMRATRAAFAPVGDELFLLGSDAAGRAVVRVLSAASERTPVDLPGYGAPVDLGFEVDAAGGAAFWALWDGGAVQRAARGPGEPWTERDVAFIDARDPVACPARFMPTGPLVLRRICDVAGVRAVDIAGADGASVRRRSFGREPLLAVRVSPSGAYLHGFDRDGGLRVFAVGGVGFDARPADDDESRVAVAAHAGPGPLRRAAMDHAVWGASARDRTVDVEAPNADAVVDVWAADYRAARRSAPERARLVVSADGRWLASAAPDGPVRLWSPSSDRSSGPIGPFGRVRALDFAHDVDGAAAALLVSVEDAVEARLLSEPADAEPSADGDGWSYAADEPAVAVAARQARAAVGDRSGRVAVLDALSGAPLWSRSAGDGAATAVAFGADDRVLFVGLSTCAVRAFDAATGRPLGDLAAARPAPSCGGSDGLLRAFVDGRVAAALGDEIRVFAPLRRDMSAWRAASTAPTPRTGRVAAIALDGDGAARALLDGADRPSLMLWRVGFGSADGDGGSTLSLGSAGSVAAFDPRRMRAAILDREGGISIHDRDGVRIGRAPNLGRGWAAAAFDPLGRWLATLDRAGGLRFWPLDDDLGRLAARIDAALSPCRSASEANELRHAVRLALDPISNWTCAADD